MQRFYFVIWVVVITLYGNVFAFATHPEGYYPGAAVPPLESVDASVPHVALMLPLQSQSFSTAAETVKEGFVTAAKREPALPLTIRVYSTTDDPLDILITYHQALDSGAVFIVGPLTRDGVTALASSHVVEVPTLALNNTGMDMMLLPPNLYFFGLQMETEAMHIAEKASFTGKSHAIIIKDTGALSERLQNAFSERWLSEYGHTAESVEYDEDQAFFSKLRNYTRGEENLIFLTLDANKARRIRAYLDPETPVYATSQVFVTSQDPLFNHDLNGIQFMDMPWLLQPDHAAVMAYRDSKKIGDKNTERLYALGIDAFRLMRNMLQVRSPYDIQFDGVTGYIQFAAPAHFIRTPLAAVFNKGKVQLMEKQ